MEEDDKETPTVENFWKQFYDGFVFYDQDDIINDTANNEIFLKEIAVGSIDVYTIVNNNFNIDKSINPTTDNEGKDINHPICILPNKRRILAKNNSKFIINSPNIYLGLEFDNTLPKQSAVLSDDLILSLDDILDLICIYYTLYLMYYILYADIII